MAPPRYLTPGKICLLLLIDLYNADFVQGPSRLDLLSFVSSHIHGPFDESQHGVLSSESQLTSSITSIEAALSRSPSGTSERSIYDLLIHCLWKLTDLDSLFTLFLSAEDLVAPSSPESHEATAKKISRASPIGQFIRRCCVEFTRLRFSDVQSLWHSLCAYRAPSYDVWASQDSEAAAELQSSQTPWEKLPVDGEILISASADDASALLSHSVSHLQKLGTRLPAPLKTQLAEWTGSLPDSSLQHFLAFFEHWRSGAYTMALEALHRYFDYCLIGQQDLAGGVNGGAGSSHGGGMKMYYQYALLHLSVLHADFERWEESAEALGECVATARENQDPTCLAFALSYLLHLRQSYPTSSNFSFNALTRLVGGGSGSGSGQDEISFLKTKAREGRHWSLLASTLMEEARVEMYSGGNVSKALECIVQSEYLCMQHDLRNMVPAGALFRGAGLERLGQVALSSQAYESIETVHNLHCPLPESVRASCRLAHDLACAGKFDHAVQTLSAIKNGAAKGILKLEQRVLMFEMLVLLRKSVYAEEFESADAYLEQLRPSRTFAEAEITFEIIILQIELHRKKQDYQMALHITNTTIRELKQSPRADLAHILHLLIVKAHLFACAGQPLKGLSIAVRAAASAELHLLVSVLTEATAVLGSILLELRKYSAARDLLAAAMPMALEGRDVVITARMFMVLAQATVGWAGHECQNGSSEQKKAIKDAQEHVENSLQAYTQVHDASGMRECLMLMARLASWEADEGKVQSIAAQLDQLTGIGRGPSML